MSTRASNEHGRCMDSEAWLTLSDDPSDDIMRDMIGKYGGPFAALAGLVPETMTANVLRRCPGATVDHTTGYAREMILGGVVIALLVIYLIIPGE